MKAEEIIADLYSKTGEKNVYGIDVSDGKVKDVAEIGILDCWETKSWAIKLCVDAVLTILKVDLISNNPVNILRVIIKYIRMNSLEF